MMKQHSEMLEEFAKIIKVAGKSDESYNVVPDGAEETGYDLTELAHPDQIQVSNSRLNDGIVESGVEMQKSMIDVALRNPRGVLAELTRTLIKAANVLDADMNADSVKMASEIDGMLEELIKSSELVLSPQAGSDVSDRQYARIKSLASEVLSRFEALDFSTFGYSSDDSKYAQSVIKDAAKKLNQFVAAGNSGDIVPLAQYINQFNKMVTKAMRDSTDWGLDSSQALTAWNNLKADSEEFLARGHVPVAPVPPQPGQGQSSKRPMGHSGYGISDDRVKELQTLVLANPVDGKFGGITLKAVNDAAKATPALKQYLDANPKLLASYANWTAQDVAGAINALKSSPSAAALATPAPPPVTPAPPVMGQ